jgi:alkanesulfonate monooxygenase SsuD/methylene tetrahydromethanopterin reductase-like flavin-dependent oxidoreductase (luciferase family)
MSGERRVSFGIKTVPVDYEQVLRVWEEAETVPEIEHAWLWDHMLPLREPRSGPMLEAWTLLAALAARTRRLRLGVMVTGNLNRLPAVLAKMAVTVDVISGGRLEFGIGAGGGTNSIALTEYEAYGIPTVSQAECVRRLDEACEIIRRMWTEPAFDYDGRYYRLRGAICEPRPVQRPHPPIVIGGSGERLTLRVVARHANTWNFPTLDLGSALQQFQRKSRVLDEHCAAIGRDPAEIERQLYAVIDLHDPEATRESLRSLIAAGATQVVLAVRGPSEPGQVERLAEAIIRPLVQEGATVAR